MWSQGSLTRVMKSLDLLPPSGEGSGDARSEVAAAAAHGQEEDGESVGSVMGPDKRSTRTHLDYRMPIYQ